MQTNFNIAVDGTAGSGKSSVMSLVAEKIGFKFIDTGLMYRAFTKWCLQNNVNFSKKDQIIELLKKLNSVDIDGSSIKINDNDYSRYINDYDVVENIKYIATISEVREKMVFLQKQMVENGRNIMVGRDITTVVLPKADLKIYFDCSPEARAQRRMEQNKKNNLSGVDYNILLNQIKARDESDMNREVGALKIAKDAWVIDTSDLAFNEVVDKVLKHIHSIKQERG